MRAGRRFQAIRASGTIPGRAFEGAPRGCLRQAQVRAVAARARSRRGAKSARAAKSARTPRGQQVISSERASQIQSALIREHYLDGEAYRRLGPAHQGCDDPLPGGKWLADQDHSRFTRADQTRISGPRHDGLLNPDSAALASPLELGADREIPGGR